jgi:hypothetical protein
MKYMLLMYWNQSEMPNYTPEEHQAIYKAWHELNHAAKEAGVLVSTNGLSPATTATTVRVRNGKTMLADGPFAETHEQLGGYYLLDCKDLDEAVAWAAKIPASQYGSIEVRPLYVNS